MCWQCVEDRYLKEVVKKQGNVDVCSICGLKRKAFTAEGNHPFVEEIA
jgi:hypothetical protein